AERAGSEAGARAAGFERLARGLGPMEDFKPVAERIGKHDKVLDAALIRKRARAAGNLNPGLLQPRGKTIERGGVGHFPTEERDTFAAVFTDEHPLLATSHPRRRPFAAPPEGRQPKNLVPKLLQFLEDFGANAEIAETLNIQGRPP